jgi:hypothetical protein
MDSVRDAGLTTWVAAPIFSATAVVSEPVTQDNIAWKDVWPDCTSPLSSGHDETAATVNAISDWPWNME